MMNKRIKELAEQAFQPINDISTEGVADRYTFEQAWFQVYNQKFAELIVRDVIDILSVYRAKITFYDGVDHNCQHPITVIQKHFGVE